MAPKLEPAPAPQPHRGGMILALGIVSLVVGLLGVPLGIIPWIMGSRDLNAMDAGVVDPAGRRDTRAGRALGIGGTVVAILNILLSVLALIYYSARGPVVIEEPPVIQMARPIDSGR